MEKLVNNRLVDLVKLEKAIKKDLLGCRFLNSYEIELHVDNFCQKNVELVAYHDAILKFGDDAEFVLEQNIDNTENYMTTVKSIISEICNLFNEAEDAKRLVC